MRAADDRGDSPREGDSLCRWGTRFREAPAYGRSAGGMNYRKKGLQRLLEMILRRRVQRLVLTHKDRLLRFGSDVVEAFPRYVLSRSRLLRYSSRVLLVRTSQRKARVRLGKCGSRKSSLPTQRFPL